MIHAENKKKIAQDRKALPGASHRLSDYLTVREAAEYLGVSRATLRRWDAKGKLTAYRHPMNGYRLYRIGDLRKLLSGIGRKEVVKS